ncbi:hypothetical protein LCGC14_3108380, partial [marine sediment metagenome]
CRRTFSRNAAAGYVTERKRELQEDVDRLSAISFDPVYSLARIDELERLSDRFELGKDRRRPQRGTLTRYDG